MKMKICLLLLCFFYITPLSASTPSGKISSLAFYGSGISEAIFVTIDPKVSDCPYKGSFVMYTKDRPAITSALLAAFHTQNTVKIHGTGGCGSSWSNYEELNYAGFTK